MYKSHFSRAISSVDLQKNWRIAIPSRFRSWVDSSTYGVYLYRNPEYQFVTVYRSQDIGPLASQLDPANQAFNLKQYAALFSKAPFLERVDVKATGTDSRRITLPRNSRFRELLGPIGSKVSYLGVSLPGSEKDYSHLLLLPGTQEEWINAFSEGSLEEKLRNEMGGTQ